CLINSPGKTPGKRAYNNPVVILKSPDLNCRPVCTASPRLVKVRGDDGALTVPGPVPDANANSAVARRGSPWRRPGFGGIAMAARPQKDPPLTLLERVQRFPADLEAWDEFVRRYQPMIRAWCRKRGLQSSDADDVAQDVLANLLTAMRGWG